MARSKTVTFETLSNRKVSRPKIDTAKPVVEHTNPLPTDSQTRSSSSSSRSPKRGARAVKQPMTHSNLDRFRKKPTPAGIHRLPARGECVVKQPMTHSNLDRFRKKPTPAGIHRLPSVVPLPARGECVMYRKQCRIRPPGGGEKKCEGPRDIESQATARSERSVA